MAASGQTACGGAAVGKQKRPVQPMQTLHVPVAASHAPLAFSSGDKGAENGAGLLRARLQLGAEHQASASNAWEATDTLDTVENTLRRNDAHRASRRFHASASAPSIGRAAARRVQDARRAHARSALEGSGSLEEEDDLVAAGLGDIAAIRDQVRRADRDGKGLDERAFVKTIGDVWADHSEKRMHSFLPFGGTAKTGGQSCASAPWRRGTELERGRGVRVKILEPSALRRCRLELRRPARGGGGHIAAEGIQLWAIKTAVSPLNSLLPPSTSFSLALALWLARSLSLALALSFSLLLAPHNPKSPARSTRLLRVIACGASGSISSFHADRRQLRRSSHLGGAHHVLMSQGPGAAAGGVGPGERWREGGERWRVSGGE
eukprot:2463624-Pleurochrysis_carterae.AAC.1